jgi:hypothetical protein
MTDYDIVTTRLPSLCIKAIAVFLAQHKTGQILLNVNRGEIQSFELKEHHRITKA